MTTLDELLDQLKLTASDKDAARNMAIAQFGLGIMGAKKGQEWNRVGLSGMNAVNAYQGGLAGAQAGKLDSLKARGAAMGLLGQEQQYGDSQAMRAAATDASAGGSFDQQKYIQSLQGIDPMKALDYQKALGKDSPFAKIDPKDYTPESVKAYMGSGNASDLRRYTEPTKPDTPIGKLNPSDFTPASMAKYAQTLNYADLQPVDKRAVTNVNVKNVSETEYDKNIGKSYADAFVATQTAGKNAAGTIAKLDAIGKLLNGVNTNATTPIGMGVASVAKSIGLTVDPSLPNKEAAQALANELALQARAGGNMPGAMSDKDREFLVAMNPNITQTPEGRAQLIDVRKKMARREQEVAALAREYAKNNGGRLDSGFEQVVADHAERNPLFTSAPAQSANSPRSVQGRINGGPAQTVYRFNADGTPAR